MDNNKLESTTRESSEEEAAAAAEVVACSTPHLVPIGAKTHKRKSRWDEGPVDQLGGGNGHDPLPETKFPPGFSPPVEHCTPKQAVMGHYQQCFVSRIVVSCGIPFNLVQKIGVPENESFGSWVVAPVQLHVQSTLMLEREGLQTVIALQDVRSEFTKLRGNLFYRVLDDLHAHLYNKCESSFCYFFEELYIN
ncbi:hypothetical protein DM860_016759 [Cuscuta australis]|uniref:Exocyst complex component Sec8 n=1 Tax=Cuscuta australis TaxID=267555 RepID=A0A328D9C4_9ASTE|nr:hypothetical protein DM860_016759 [Cuscuta australis]